MSVVVASQYGLVARKSPATEACLNALELLPPMDTRVREFGVVEDDHLFSVFVATSPLSLDELLAKLAGQGLKLATDFVITVGSAPRPYLPTEGVPWLRFGPSKLDISPETWENMTPEVQDMWNRTRHTVCELVA